MKFIFPQNYDFKNKLFGFLDYPTLLLNAIWLIIFFLISNIIFKDLLSKIFLIIIFCLPLLLLSFSGFNGENIVYILFYVLNFQLKQKLYFYNKFPYKK